MNPTWTTFPVHRSTKKAAVAWGALKPGQKIPVGPDQDVGVACGAKTGIVVIDLDVKNGKRGPEAFAALGPCPETLQVKTPSGGAHLYFEAPEGIEIPNSVEKLGSGIDVRGDGGYVVAPPSPGYTIAHRAPIAALPDWLLALIRKQERPPVEPSAPVTKITANRNITLTSMAGHMLRAGFGDEAVRAALHEANRTQCVPPLPDAEVEATLGQAAKWASRGAPKADKNGPTPGFAPLSREEMLAPVPPPNHLIPDLDIGPGRPVQLLGMGSAGKSLIGQAMMLAVVSGKPCFAKFRVRQGSCAWIDFEMGRSPSLRRLRRLAAALGITWDHFVDQVAFSSMPRTYLNSADAEEHLVALCEGRAALFIDSLRRGVPGVDENDSAISEFLQMLLRVSEQTGTTVIFLHHSSTKVPPDGLDARGKGRGSSAIYDGSGAVFHLGGQLGEPVTVTQTRVGEAGTRADDFQLVIRDVEIDGLAKAGLEVVYAEAEKRPERDELCDELLDVIKGENFKGERVSQRGAIDAFTEHRRALGKKSVNRDRLIVALERLVAKGLVEDLNLGGKGGQEFWARDMQGRKARQR